jgi:hypothetical protein
VRVPWFCWGEWKFLVVAAMGASANGLVFSFDWPVRFESKPHQVTTRMFPPVAVRVTGDVSTTPARLKISLNPHNFDR